MGDMELALMTLICMLGVGLGNGCSSGVVWVVSGLVACNTLKCR